MLVRLEFNFENREDEAIKFGSYYETDRMEVYGKECDVLVQRVDSQHKFWAGQFENNETRFPALGFIAEYEPGIYIVPSFNFHGDIESLTDYRESHDYRKIRDVLSSDGTYRGEYGVADSIEQVKEYFGDVLNDPSFECVIALTEVRKKDQEEGGWRWHKWGAYIGTQNPQCEYLKDEPEIESVFCFHLYVLNKE